MWVCTVEIATDIRQAKIHHRSLPTTEQLMHGAEHDIAEGRVVFNDQCNSLSVCLHKA